MTHRKNQRPLKKNIVTHSTRVICDNDRTSFTSGGGRRKRQSEISSFNLEVWSVQILTTVTLRRLHSTSTTTTSTARRRSLCAAGTTVRGSRSPSKPSTCWWFTCADTRGRNHTSARWVMERSSLGSALSKRHTRFCTKRCHFSPGMAEQK